MGATLRGQENDFGHLSPRSDVPREGITLGDLTIHLIYAEDSATHGNPEQNMAEAASSLFSEPSMACDQFV
jgi:hypothetical protein